MMKKKKLMMVIICFVLSLVIGGCAPQSTEETGKQDNTYTTNLTKVSKMISDNVGEEVTTAAKTVIEAFLQHENSAKITISGNTDRFMNDMAYVIHCTCPLFLAFTDFNEMSAYNKKTGEVSWNYFVEKEEFDAKVKAFYKTSDEYLASVSKTDSEAMKATLLYYAIINDLNYDYDLIGDNYNKLSKEDANMRSSSYNVLVSKNGICTNMSQAYMYLCTQADIECGTVLHTGGIGMHMWNIVKIDDKYYYCDPTWDANASLKYFGITAADRASWAGEYASNEGTMLSVNIP